MEPALHGIEAAIWAAAYVWLGALDSPIEAMLYSVDSMTTPLSGDRSRFSKYNAMLAGFIACGNFAVYAPS